LEDGEMYKFTIEILSYSSIQQNFGKSDFCRTIV
jgi:hypothetical protein